MDRTLKIVAGLALGAMFGVGLVLLFAPQSGEETRRLIQERINDILEEGRLAADNRRLELMTQFEALKQPAPKV